MRKTGVAALMAGMMVFLSGCGKLPFLPDAREIEGMDLVRTVGVDADGEGRVLVTVSTGEQSQGGGQGDSPALVLSQSAPSISRACLAMQGKSTANLFYGHVAQLLLGEEMARADVEQPLEYVLDDIEMRLDIDLYLVWGDTAQTLLNAAAKEGSADARLDAMAADTGLRSWSSPRTVGEVLEDLLDNGCSYAPAVRLTGQEEQQELEAIGYGLIQDGKLCAWAAGESAHGINLLTGQVEADLLTVEVPEMGPFSVRLVGAETSVKPDFTGDRLSGVDIVCKVDANLAEGGAHLDQEGPEEVRKLETAVEEQVKGRLESALSLCRTYGADFFQLERKTGVAAPWHQGKLETQWDIKTVPLNVTAEVTIPRGYDAS